MICNQDSHDALAYADTGVGMSNTVSKHHLSWRTGRVSRPRSNVPPLPGNVQDHLGRLLRAEYYERGDKPRYLGDPALPVEFDPYLRRLELKEAPLRTRWIRERGAKAIADALKGLEG